MPDKHNFPNKYSRVRFERATQIPWIIALSGNLFIAVNVFIIPAWLGQTGSAQVYTVYGAFCIIFLPVVLTLVEQSLASHIGSNNGLLNILLATKKNLIVGVGSWMLILGYLGVSAVLASTFGDFLSLLIQLVTSYYIPATWLSLLLVLFLGLVILSGSDKIGSLRARISFIAIGIILLYIIQATLQPNTTIQAPNTTSSVNLWTAVAYIVSGLWGIGLILDFRRGIPRSSKFIPITALALLVLSSLIGIAVLKISPTDLTNLEQLMPDQNPETLEIIVLFAGLLVFIIALIGLVKSLVDLLQDLRKMGFRSNGVDTDKNSHIITLAAIILIGVLSSTVQKVSLIGLASLSLLWFIMIVNGYKIIRARQQTKQKRSFQLPFHPLFPGLALVISLFISLALQWEILVTGLFWLVIGFILFWLFARKNTSLNFGEEITVFGPSKASKPIRENHVLTIISDPYSAISIIRLGAKISQANNGHLIVLQALDIPDYLPQNFRQEEAQQQLTKLEDYIQRAEVEDEKLPITTIVNITKDIISCISDTINEFDVELLLLGWQGSRKRKKTMELVWDRLMDSGDADPSPPNTNKRAFLLDEQVLETILASVSCDVAILQGQYPAAIRNTIVPTIPEDGGLLKAVELSNYLLQDLGAEGKVIFIQTQAEAQPDLVKAKERLMNLSVEFQVIRSENLQSGNLRPTNDNDLYIYGLPATGLLDDSIFSGDVSYLASEDNRNTIYYRGSQNSISLFFQRTWRSFQGIFPKLSQIEQANIITQMQTAAVPSVDFFLLISLAATIATFGLLQDSAAVIIGAMLVAPLMSPIASTAMGIVQGDTTLMRIAAEAAIKGIFLAISVAILITLITPDPSQVNEILARTRPNLLDLAVALASGAAAGYALSRKNVSAALPGVSISVALVPPLCVVGYGIATSDLRIAGGAFLLFATNVIAIILSAAVLFLLLGFRPIKQQQGKFQMALLVSITSFVVIMIPLAILLNVSLKRYSFIRQQLTTTNNIQSLLEEKFPLDIAELAETQVDFEEYGYKVNIVVHNFTDFDESQVIMLEEYLNMNLEKPVNLEAIILDATKTGKPYNK